MARTMLGRMTRSFANFCHFSVILTTPTRRVFWPCSSDIYEGRVLHASIRVQLLQALFQQQQPRFSGSTRQGHADHTLGEKTKAWRCGLEPLQQAMRLDGSLWMKRQEHLQATLFDTFEKELTSEELDFDHQQQTCHCRWRGAKTVLELLLQGLKSCRLGEQGTAPIDFQALRFAVHIRLREIPLDFQAQLRFNAWQHLFPTHGANGFL